MSTILSMNNVNKSFGEKIILKDFSLTINEGDFVCIKGESGSGKSTLLNIIGLLEPYDSGELELFGINNIKTNSEQARKMLENNIGFLFQNFGLIDNKSVKYNLDLVCRLKKIPKKEWSQCQLSILTKLNLNVGLNEKIYKLSGGEQQRIAIARLILKKCRLILADEPTSSLDKKNSNEVFEHLKELTNNGVAVLVSTHDDNLTEKFNKIIEL